jgi:hypothetical protein
MKSLEILFMLHDLLGLVAADDTEEETGVELYN